MTTLHDAIKTWRVRPFARGTGDCCAFADHVVEAMTGQSHLPEYETDAEAEAIIADAGGLSPAVSKWMAREPVEFEELVAGDVVLIDVQGHEAVGILVKPGRVATVLETGELRMVSSTFVRHGWKAGLEWA